jgi:autophagy-related protein 2
MTQLIARIHLGKLRVRIHNANVSIQLHEGYDWVRTRKTIEEEIKAVRRRLAKIRQLLASGQKADESLEKSETGSMLFNSVYIGLNQDQDGLEDPAALLAAIDDELEEGQSEMNTQSSWQTLPGGPAPALGVEGERRKTTSTSRLNGKRLTRSKKAQIEINLTGIKAEYDLYQPQHDVASRVNTTIQSMEILDHIKTSTWKKFLTEMKSDARGNVRETDANMVRVELVAVRPSLPSLSEESRLKVSS